MVNLQGEFVYKKSGVLYTVSTTNDIPDDFDHIIKFYPEAIPEPHTEEQHTLMNSYNGVLQQLMEKERARYM
jgi:hypothetical protein